MLLDVLIDGDEGSTSAPEADRRLLLTLLPLEDVCLIHSVVKWGEREGHLLGQASEHPVDPLEVLITNGTRHVHEDSDVGRVAPGRSGMDVGVLPVDSTDRGGLVQSLTRPDKVLEDLRPVDGILNHLAESLTHRS